MIGDPVSAAYERHYAWRTFIIAFCIAEWGIAAAILSEQNPFAIYALVWSPLWALAIAAPAAVLGFFFGRIAAWRKSGRRWPAQDVIESLVLLAVILCVLVGIVLWEVQGQSRIVWLRRAGADQLRSQDLERLSLRQLSAIVENPNAPLVLIDRIARLSRTDLNLCVTPWWWPTLSSDPTLLGMIARRNRIAEKTLIFLVKSGVGRHTQAAINREVALNAGCLDDCLSALILKADSANDDSLRCWVGRHPRLPIEVARRWVLQGDSLVRASIAENTGLSRDLFARLTGDADWLVRLAVACNIACPDDLLVELTGDFNQDVSSAALATQRRKASRKRTGEI